MRLSEPDQVHQSTLLNTMSEYQEHSLETVDLTILERISEDDVTAWLVARLHQLRESGVEMSSMDLECWFRNFHGKSSYVTRFGGHGANQCAGQPTVKEMVKELRKKQLDDPAGKAREKRDKARRLIKEAERLEVIAKSI